MSEVDVNALVAAVQLFAGQCEEITPGWGDVFHGFSCREIDAMAQVFKFGGEPEAAAHVIARHSEDDDVITEAEAEDPQFDLSLMDCHARIGFYAREANDEGPWEVAMQHARRYVAEEL